jgi:hypothetical protein
MLCEAGTYSSEDGIECIPCQHGFVSSVGFEYCEPCDAGKVRVESMLSYYCLRR